MMYVNFEKFIYSLDNPKEQIKIFRGFASLWFSKNIQRCPSLFFFVKFLLEIQHNLSSTKKNPAAFKKFKSKFQKILCILSNIFSGEITKAMQFAKGAFSDMINAP